MIRSVWIQIAFLAPFICVAAHAARPGWNIDTLSLVGTVGVEHCFDLNTIVASPSVANTFHWANLGEPLPLKMSIVQNRDLCYTPAAAGTYSFDVIVQAPGSDDLQGLPATLKVDPPQTDSALCANGNAASLIGSTPDGKFNLFACPK